MSRRELCLSYPQRIELRRIATVFAVQLKDNSRVTYRSALFSRVICDDTNNPPSKAWEKNSTVRIDILAPLEEACVLAVSYELALDPGQDRTATYAACTDYLMGELTLALVEEGLLGSTEREEVRRQIEHVCPVGTVITVEVQENVSNMLSEVLSSWRIYNNRISIR